MTLFEHYITSKAHPCLNSDVFQADREVAGIILVLLLLPAALLIQVACGNDKSDPRGDNPVHSDATTALVRPWEFTSKVPAPSPSATLGPVHTT